MTINLFTKRDKCLKIHKCLRYTTQMKHYFNNVNIQTL